MRLLKLASRDKKHELYKKAFLNTAREIIFTAGNDKHELMKKLIVYGVKMLNTERKSLTPEDVFWRLQMSDLIQGMMGKLKPSEFVNLFPITKEYDGHKYGVKDYFYTMNFLKTLPDKPIGETETVLNFLWEYKNIEVSMFVVNVLGSASDLRELNGQPSIMEEWADMNGIKTYKMHTDPKGKRFLIDGETGKSFRVRRKTPRYLRLMPQAGR